MSNKSKERSIRGEIVDFDLLRVKQTMEGSRKPNSVEMREKYIDIRRRRNPRRNVADLVNEQEQNAMNAKEKIRQSREARKAKETEEAQVPKTTEVNTEIDNVVGEVTVDDEPVVTPTTTTPKKKIAKRKSSDES